VLLRSIIFQRFFILHFHVFSVTRCHHSYNELASYAFFVFVRHTTHCFLLLVCYMFCGRKHSPEEAYLNRWAKRWLIIKYNHQKSLFICLFDLQNVRQAKYLFSATFVGTDSDCDVINALCPKPVIAWKFFLMCFDNEINTTYKDNQTCLSELRSTGIPAIRNKLLGTDFYQRI